MLQKLLRRQKVLSVSALLLMFLSAQLTLAQSDAGAGALRGEISNADGQACRECCHNRAQCGNRLRSVN